MESQKPKMIYRNLGNTGLKVSVISYGYMPNYREETKQQDKQIIKKCIDYGINCFDTAEAYSKGLAQIRLGQILQELQVQRQSIIITTKVWVSPDPDLNSKKTLNRKHIKESINYSLQRLGLQYVDVVFAHAYDEKTPLQQVCRSFHEVIQDGQSFYWGTSNWDADSIYQAFLICEKNNLHKPICAQNQYHLLSRKQMEQQYKSLFQKYHYGFMSWSSLAGGLLTGKYLNGINFNQLNRFSDKYITPQQQLMKIHYEPYDNQKTKKKLLQIQKIAQQQLNSSLAQISLAFIIKNKHLSTAIIGARNIQQFQQNIQSLNVIDSLKEQIIQRINKIFKQK